MAVRKINESTLTAIGNAIRSKTGGSALINPEDMADEIDSIQTGGGGDEHLFQYIEFTPTRDGTYANRYSVSLDPIPSGYKFVVSVAVKNMPQAPSEGYTALIWALESMNNGAQNAILRANGTIGTDATLATFNASTGALQVGGQYGTFREGLTYCVRVFLIGNAN